MIVLLDSDVENEEKNRPFVHLAQRQAAALRESTVGNTDRRKLLDIVLAEADDLYRQGFEVEARLKWRSIVQLYSGNRELRVHVEQAEARLADPEQALITPEAPTPSEPLAPSPDNTESRPASATLPENSTEQ